jgi:eukaryotic-like serine/threonine-protein kinase
MTPESPLPAQVGRYRVVKELGKGAMGRVLLAEDPVLRRNVAIKHLRGDLSLAPEQRKALLERMSQEARASARVNHPHLVALYDMGEDPELGLYLVFEYVEGVTLHERLKTSVSLACPTRH